MKIRWNRLRCPVTVVVLRSAKDVVDMSCRIHKQSITTAIAAATTTTLSVLELDFHLINGIITRVLMIEMDDPWEYRFDPDHISIPLTPAVHCGIACTLKRDGPKHSRIDRHVATKKP